METKTRATAIEPISARYHELRGFREEGLARLHSRVGDFIGGPPTRVVFPTTQADTSRKSKRLGPLTIAENTPLMEVVVAEIEKRAQTRIFELGPGDGALCAFIKARFGERISAYDALELDPHVEGPYTRVSSIAGLREAPQLTIAAEVFEHIPLDQLHEVVGELARALAPDGTLVSSTPNPLSPGGIARDATHVTYLPWYDLYALLRLSFAEVTIIRTYYVWSLSRLLGLPIRALTARSYELDWCDGIVAIARRPRVG